MKKIEEPERVTNASGKMGAARPARSLRPATLAPAPFHRPPPALIKYPSKRIFATRRIRSFLIVSGLTAGCSFSNPRTRKSCQNDCYGVVQQWRRGCPPEQSLLRRATHCQSWGWRHRPNGLRLQVLRRLEREYSLAAELKPAWAAKPLALTRHEGRTILVLNDPGGEPLDRILERDQGPPLDLTRCLPIASRMRVRLPCKTLKIRKSQFKFS